MEKQAVDDLFKKLMDVGIIKKVNETGCLSPARVSTPPMVDSQILNTITIPEVQQEIPEIKLTLDHLRRYSCFSELLSFYFRVKYSQAGSTETEAITMPGITNTLQGTVLEMFLICCFPFFASCVKALLENKIC